MSKNYINHNDKFIVMIDSKLVNNASFHEKEFDDIIVKKLVSERIKYFSNVLLKYLRMHENVFDEEDHELYKLRSILENM